MGDRNDSKKQKNEISVAKFLQTPRYGPQNTEIPPYRNCEFLWEAVFLLCRSTEVRLNSVGGSTSYFATEMIYPFPSTIGRSGL